MQLHSQRWLLVLVLSTGAGAQVQVGDFDAPVGFDTGQYLQANFPYAMAVGDLDQDGTPDVVTTNWFAFNKLSLLLNNGEGALEEPQFLTNGRSSFDVTLAHLNDDGFLDIVASDYGTNGQGNTVSVLLGLGGGSFAPYETYPTGSGSFVGPVGIGCADLDQDDDADLIVANYGRIGLGDTVAVLYNDGQGRFGQPVIYDVAGKPYKLAVGDLDGDDVPDVVVAHDGQKMSVLMGNGSGLDAPVVYDVFSSVNTDIYANVALADVDRDNDLDVFYGSTNTVANNQYVIALFLNDGNGQLAAPIGVPTDPYLGSAAEMRVADVTGDGWVDILSVHLDSGGWLYKEGDGSGGFLPGVELPGGRDPIAVEVADMDGDLDPDALVLARNTLMVSVVENDGTGFRRRIGYPMNGLDIDDADIDGDGDLDVVGSYGYAGSGGISVVKNAGDGTFEPSVNYTGDAAMTVKLRDLNGDDRPDLLWADHPTAFVNGYNFQTRMNLGDGTFGPARVWFVGTCGNGDVDAFDMDDDGDLDVFLTDYLGCAGGGSSNFIWISRNRGDGTFDAPYRYTTVFLPQYVRGADVNDDGFTDLLWTSAGGLGVGLGHGDGTFDPPVRFATDQGAQELVAADLNGDDIADVATCNSGNPSESISVLISRGDGSFAPAVTYRAGNDNCCLGVGNIIAGDADDDGDLDLMVAGNGNGTVSLFRNAGDGSFARQIRYVGGYTASDLRFGNFDEDHLEDLVVLSGTPPSNLSKELMLLRGARDLGPNFYCTAKPGLTCGLPAMGAIGEPSASASSGFFLFAGPAVAQRPGLLLYSDAGRAALPFQGGLLCVQPAPLLRAVTVSSGGAASTCEGEFLIDLNAFAQGLLGGNPAPFLTVAGTLVNGQWWGRDTVATGSFLSDAVEYEIRP